MENGSGPAFALARAACCALLPALAGCLFETAAPDPASMHALAYRLEAPKGGGCRVSVRIEAWPSGSPKLFQAPVYYSDNPICPVPGLHAADLDVRDAAGVRLAARDTASGIPAEGNLILLPDAARSFAYPVAFPSPDRDRFGLPVPGIGAGVDILDGAYFFVLPVLAEGIAERWRAPARLSLDIAAPGRTLVGGDPHRDLSSPYELMFFRAALDPLRALTAPIPGHELTIYATSDTAFDMAGCAGLLAACIRNVEDSLLPLPTYRYFAGETPVFDGIEGIQGYWFRGIYAGLPTVHAHELIHTFVGIYHGDRDDPWWKEGLTEYLGVLLPLQTGQIHDSVFAKEALADHGAAAAVRDIALSSPAVRTRLFLPLDSAWKQVNDPDGYLELVYGKGAQASMILDRWILERSGGRRSVYDLVRALARHGTAFTRAQLIADVGSLAGAPPEKFLSDLLDRPGAFPADSLRATYLALRALGRFAPGGGKAQVRGADLPAEGPAAKAAHALPAPDLPAAGGGSATVTQRLPGGAKL